MISDVLSLGLINGVDCMMSPPRCVQRNVVAATGPSGRKRRRSSGGIHTNIPIVDHVVPVSRCDVQGVIVNVERRAGSTLYLLDDGTGLLDCIRWENYDDDVYTLPPLVEASETNCAGPEYGVGDQVRIWGRIRLVYVGAGARAIDLAVSANGEEDDNSVVERHEIPKDVVREIAVVSMKEAIILGKRNMDCLDCEAAHWLGAIHLGKRIAISGPSSKETKNGIASCQQNLKHSCNALIEPVRNGGNVMDLLGDDIMSRVAGVGSECPCNLRHKEPLLYCHCQATLEPLDPSQNFRDALLVKLISEEQGMSSGPLHFGYGAVLKDKTLFEIAKQTVSKTPNPAANARRLFVNTFRALRDDGIIHLIDESMDIYMLISRKGVLEPYLLEKQIVLGKDSSTSSNSTRLMKPPSYLRNVPHKRLKLVKRALSSKRMREETPPIL